MWGVFLIIMNYFHDLAVAILASNVLVVFFLGRYLDRHGADPKIMPALFAKLTKVTYGALTFVILMGAVRSYFFMEMEWQSAANQGLIEALVVKHVVLVALTVFGVVGQIKYRKKYGG